MNKNLVAIYEALSSANEPMTATQIANIAGCSYRLVHWHLKKRPEMFQRADDGTAHPSYWTLADATGGCKVYNTGIDEAIDILLNLEVTEIHIIAHLLVAFDRNLAERLAERIYETINRPGGLKEG